MRCITHYLSVAGWQLCGACANSRPSKPDTCCALQAGAHAGQQRDTLGGQFEAIMQAAWADSPAAGVRLGLRPQLHVCTARLHDGRRGDQLLPSVT